MDGRSLAILANASRSIVLCDAVVEEALAPGAVAPVEDDGPKRISYPKPLFGHRLLAFAIDSLGMGAGYVPMFVWYAATEDTTFSLRRYRVRGRTWPVARRVRIAVSTRREKNDD